MRLLFFIGQLALACLILTTVQGCGGGGGGSEANSSSAGAMGGITVSLTPSTQALAKQLSQSTLPAPTNIRFLVTNSTTGFSAIQDVTVPITTSVTIPVPVANGYTIEALSYVASTSSYGYNNLLKYDQAGGVAVS